MNCVDSQCGPWPPNHEQRELSADDLSSSSLPALNSNRNKRGRCVSSSIQNLCCQVEILKTTTFTSKPTPLFEPPLLARCPARVLPRLRPLVTAFRHRATDRSAGDVYDMSWTASVADAFDVTLARLGMFVVSFGNGCTRPFCVTKCYRPGRAGTRVFPLVFSQNPVRHRSSSTSCAESYCLFQQFIIATPGSASPDTSGNSSRWRKPSASASYAHHSFDSLGRPRTCLYDIVR